MTGGGESGLLLSSGHDVLRVIMTMEERRSIGEDGGGVGENCGESLLLLNNMFVKRPSVLLFFSSCRVDTYASAQFILFTSGSTGVGK